MTSDIYSTARDRIVGSSSLIYWPSDWTTSINVADRDSKAVCRSDVFRDSINMGKPLTFGGVCGERSRFPFVALHSQDVTLDVRHSHWSCRKSSGGFKGPLYNS